jgi:sugar/nucleoside kinase (ribokinase family)
MGQATVVKNGAKNLEQNWTRQKAVVGFDGFIDEIIHVVKERQNDKSYTRIETITEFAKKVGDASGLSANVEFVPQQVKLGGNGPIMANALIAQGHDIDYIGALGNGDIDPIYKEFADSCSEVISLTGPGRTDALEFDDGKLMLAKMNNLVDVNWETLTKMVDREKLKQICASAKLLSFTNWTELPNFNSLLIGFNEILSEIDNRPGIFIDLADPAKRTDEDLREVLKLITALEDNGEIIFGLNENESTQIAELYNIDEEDFSIRAEKIREVLKVSSIVIHPIAGAAVADKDGTSWIDGPYTPKPKLTTGAGDNFNSGFCNAWMTGLSGAESIAVGVSTSGYYVRNCRSPKRDELVQFMNAWADIDCGLI